MIKLNLRLDDGRRTTTITLPEEFKLTLDADSIEALIDALGRKRSLMLPKVPPDFDGGELLSPENPRWRVSSRETGRGALLLLRDPRYGWISYAFDRESLQELIAGLNNIDK